LISTFSNQDKFTNIILVNSFNVILLSNIFYFLIKKYYQYVSTKENLIREQEKEKVEMEIELRKERDNLEKKEIEERDKFEKKEKRKEIN